MLVVPVLETASGDKPLDARGFVLFVKRLQIDPEIRKAPHRAEIWLPIFHHSLIVRLVATIPLPFAWSHREWLAAFTQITRCLLRLLKQMYASVSRVDVYSRGCGVRLICEGIESFREGKESALRHLEWNVEA